MKKWVISMIGGALIGGAAGMYAGSKIMYNKCHESMMEVEEELNRMLFELKDKEKKAENTCVSVPVVESTTLTWNSGVVPAEAVAYEASIQHTPAFKSIEEKTNVTVIDFDDFETIPEYESEVLFFYPDTGDILDDQHQPISKTKIKTMIPDDFASHFDEYDEDPDCVRVRNDDLKTYYEILRYYTSP